MFRFRLGSVPVHVHTSHLLFSAVFAYQSLPLPGRHSGAGWLGDQLADASSPGHMGAVVSYVLAWMFIVFVSVLVHELGHAVAFRFFGYQPSVDLVFMGGVTRPNTDSPLPWHKDVVSSFAGPLAGLTLGVLCWVVLMQVRGRSEVADFFLSNFFFANMVWAVLNLLPVPPLDGGHISTALATRMFGRRGFIVSHVLALGLCVGLVLLSIKSGALFMGVLFAMFGFQAFRVLSDVMRARNEAKEEEGPTAQALREAQQALREDRLDDAWRQGNRVLETEGLSPNLTSRTHYLLGWVALKQGHGRPALDHFSQVQGQPVEMHAVAAAFSLVGDDARAVGYWKQAWGESQDRTVMHEYAGALIRLGQVNEALRLPGVDPASAFRCAERALFIRGAYSEAAAVSEAALQHVPDPGIAYDAACAFARAGNVADAVRLLQRAEGLGFKDAAYAASDEDLAHLHGHPAFEEWLARLRPAASS
ncbi:M50 family peptidase [Corallococcus coralloides DSM 2259]|uniref:M50 family peptidase n=1 Tax=Corallococcus coralloides (strain ATCC 25202 / DSM 2259 / NBRC 100086 / M2) TaxID=1144275 RepID=H8N2C2_CORCM|nr:site-2 protease family protein [Corallococcus coralloides]AFE07220.1 M50 family peptidase [Corallococcus coralloides DSM 2259]